MLPGGRVRLSSSSRVGFRVERSRERRGNFSRTTGAS